MTIIGVLALSAIAGFIGLFAVCAINEDWKHPEWSAFWFFGGCVLCLGLMGLWLDHMVTTGREVDRKHAYHDGYEAFRSDLPVNANPYFDERGTSWQRGWIAAQKDKPHD